MPNVTWFPLQMPPQTNMMVAFVLVKSYYICSAVIVNKKVTLFAFQSGIAKKKPQHVTVVMMHSSLDK